MIAEKSDKLQFVAVSAVCRRFRSLSRFRGLSRSRRVRQTEVCRTVGQRIFYETLYETNDETTDTNAFDLPKQRTDIRPGQGTRARLSRSGDSEFLQMVRACVESEL